MHHNFKHGGTVGGKPTPEYQCWRAMMKRCYDPNLQAYPRYGGAGVTVCDRWRNNFPAFLEDMGPRPSATHSIDRFPDPAGNYEPGNCRWATKTEQQRNQRETVRYEVGEERLTLIEWAERHGVRYRTAWKRINDLGWTPEKACTTPEREEVMLTLDGETLQLSDWSRRLGISYLTLYTRLKKGLPVEQVLGPLTRKKHAS